MLFGIVSMILVGASWLIPGIIMGKAPKQKIDVSCFLFVYAFVSGLISLGCGMATGFPHSSLRGTLIALLSLILCGVCNYFQLYFLSKAMQKGPNGIIWSICQSGLIFPFFMGIVFFHEPLNWFQGAGFLSIILAVIFFGMCKDNSSVSGPWRLLALLAFLATGFTQSFQNLTSYFPETRAIPSFWRTAIYCCGMMLGAISCNLTQLKSSVLRLTQQLSLKMLWLYTLILGGSVFLVVNFLQFPGLDRLAKLQMGAVAFPIMVSSCLISFDLFSLLILREKHKFLQWIATALCIAGVICLSIRAAPSA